MDITYLISSHVSYWLRKNAPAHRLLGSMAGTPAHRRLVVVGGHTHRDVGYDSRARVLYVTHNSFDYTALIAVLDTEIETTEHLFVLHDTMEFGRKTAELIHTADPSAPATAVFGGQCNLGLLRRDYLQSRAAEVIALKNCSKRRAVEAEGFLWKGAGSYPNAAMTDEGEGRPYNGAPRKCELYHGIRIRKWKANWGQNMEAMEARP